MITLIVSRKSLTYFLTQADRSCEGLKLPESTLKSDLVSMLKSMPLRTLNRSTSLNALPPNILTDIRFISIRPSVREPMIETYISALPEAPEDSDFLPEDAAAMLKQKQDKERRKALADRQMQAQREKRRAREAIDRGKGVMREEEHEVQRAMKVGKEGLLSYMEREGLP